MMTFSDCPVITAGISAVFLQNPTELLRKQHKIPTLREKRADASAVITAVNDGGQTCGALFNRLPVCRPLPSQHFTPYHELFMSVEITDGS